jgi:hypothetical protein
MHDIEHAFGTLVPLFVRVPEIAAWKALDARITFAPEPGDTDHTRGLNHAALFGDG